MSTKPCPKCGNPKQFLMACEHCGYVTPLSPPPEKRPPSSSPKPRSGNAYGAADGSPQAYRSPAPSSGASRMPSSGWDDFGEQAYAARPAAEHNVKVTVRSRKRTLLTPETQMAEPQMADAPSGTADGDTSE